MIRLKIIITTGKRKRAVARAVVKPGTGNVRINNVDLSVFQPKSSRLKLGEPLIIAGEIANKVDIVVKVKGGGLSGQTDAARLAMARGLLESTKDKKLEKAFLDYDRHLLVADVRQKEVRKPNRHGKARAKTQKSYR